jgi:O-antigen ligase
MDPFIHWFHWQPEQFPGSRMRVYGTLGNPNFVAAWLCATLPFHLPLCLGDGWKKSKRRSMAVILLAIQLLAILATGSRVFPVAMGILLLTLLLLARRRIFLIALPVALVSMVLLFLMSPTRSLGTTLAGRWFIAGTILEHWKEIPFFGFGPGAFPEQFARWQNEWLQVTAVGNPQLRFAGPLDHAHNDYLELLVNFGYAGLAAFLAFCLPLFRDFIKSKAGSADKLLLAARLSPPLILLAIALVDFPFQRPAEWGLFWLLRGTAHEQVLREKEDRGG